MPFFGVLAFLIAGGFYLSIEWLMKSIDKKFPKYEDYGYEFTKTFFKKNALRFLCQFLVWYFFGVIAFWFAMVAS